MSEYTPTVVAFRYVYGQMCAEWCRGDALAEFDRLIARIKADAWDEGYEAGMDDELGHQRGVTLEDLNQYTPNPYREEESK